MKIRKNKLLACFLLAAAASSVITGCIQKAVKSGNGTVQSKAEDIRTDQRPSEESGPSPTASGTGTADSAAASPETAPTSGNRTAQASVNEATQASAGNTAQEEEQDIIDIDDPYERRYEASDNELVDYYGAPNSTRVRMLNLSKKRFRR